METSLSKPVAAMRSRRMLQAAPPVFPVLRQSCQTATILWPRRRLPHQEKDLAPFLKSVKRFFRKHKEHPAIVESIKVLDEWLYEGVILASNGGGKACQELRRLYDSGIRGKDVLEVAGAVWLMSHHLPAMIPDDERLTFALSRAILQTCPQTERITGFSSTGEAKRSHNRAGATVHRVVGQFIRDSIGIVYYRMFEAMARDTEREKQQRQDRKHRLRMPFVNGTEDGP